MHEKRGNACDVTRQGSLRLMVLAEHAAPIKSKSWSHRYLPYTPKVLTVPHSQFYLERNAAAGACLGACPGSLPCSTPAGSAKRQLKLGQFMSPHHTHLPNMSSSLHGQMDVEITHPQSSEPTGTGLRKSTLNLNPSSSPSGSSSPQSPTPLLGISLNGDTEALNEQGKPAFEEYRFFSDHDPSGHEKSFLTRLRQTASLQKHEPSITFNTKVPPDIRAGQSHGMIEGRMAD